MSEPTPSEVAAWPAPNYIDPETRVTVLIATLATGLALMLPFIFGRIYIRLKLRRGFGVDDWIIFVAAVRLQRLGQWLYFKARRTKQLV